MRELCLRILKSGLPTGLAAGLIGYCMASLGVIFYTSQSDIGRTPEDFQTISEASDSMKLRMPILFFGACFSLICVFETCLYLIRPKVAVVPLPKQLPGLVPASTVSGMDPEVEALLNQILAQEQPTNLTHTPLPAAVVETRTLSTTH
jgi:hypothetical protein